MRALLLLLLVGCSTPRGPWHVRWHLPEELGPQSVAMVEAAKRVTPDARGYLARGGVIEWYSGANDALKSLCPVPPGRLPSGCSSPGKIDVLFWPWEPLNHAFVGPDGLFVADITRTSLAHELCHLGLTPGVGIFGGASSGPSEAEADGCAGRVLDEFLRGVDGQVFK